MRGFTKKKKRRGWLRRGGGRGGGGEMWLIMCTYECILSLISFLFIILT